MLEREDTDLSIKPSTAYSHGDEAQRTEPKKRLRDRTPKRAEVFAARTSAVMQVSHVPGKEPYRVTVRLPESLENEPVALALINGLQVRPDASFVSAYFRWKTVKRFLVFASDHLVEGRLPKDIFDLYRASQNESNVAQRTVAARISGVKMPLEAGAENPDFMANLSDDAQDHVLSVIAGVPSIPKSASKKRPGMGELFEDLPDDRPLFDGLRHFATWTLLEHQSHRKDLLQDAEVRAALDEAMAMVDGDIDALAWGSRIIHPRDQWNPTTLCNAIFEAICHSDSPTLKERLLLGLPAYRRRLLDKHKSTAVRSIKELDEQLARCRLVRRTGKRCNNQAVLSVNTRSLNLAQCDLLSLVKPTDAEHICVQWLLAGVAVQTSGQQRAQLGDYVIQAGSSYLNYIKKRAKSKHKHTDSIKAKSAMGRALMKFIELKEAGQTDSTRLLEMDYLGNPPSSTSPRWRFLMAATSPQSAIRRAFLETHPMGEEFLVLLTELRAHGDLSGNYRSRKCVIDRKIRNGSFSPAEHEHELQEILQSSPVTSAKTLRPDHIRNTRIALQRSTPGLTAAQREAEERAQASSNGHTADIMKYVYQARDSSKFRIKERGEFAAAIGEIMTALSQQIRDAYSSTKVLTPERVAEIVGLEHGFETEDERADRLLAELDANGYRLNYFGAHTKGKERIVVAEPVTVALMLSARDTYIARAKDQSLPQEERIEAALETALIEDLLERMPDDVVGSGQQLFKKKVFPALIPLSEGE